MIDNVHDLIIALEEKRKKIILSPTIYDWLLKSNWNCVLSDNLKEYSKTHEVLRGGRR